MKRSVRWGMTNMKNRWLPAFIIAATSSAGCALGATGGESGGGSASFELSAETTPPTYAAPVLTKAAAFKPYEKSFQCADFAYLEQECRWFACQGETCLAIQMCWRPDIEHDDGSARCTFWDYPSDDLCCPDTAGQVVDAH